MTVKYQIVSDFLVESSIAYGLKQDKCKLVYAEAKYIFVRFSLPTHAAVSWLRLNSTHAR